jgi:hypothetical protein
VWATKNPHFNKLTGVNMNISAFPLAFRDKQSGKTKVRVGMDLRDFFASSFVSSGYIFKSISDGDTPILVAEQAYVMADAMLEAKELSRPKSKESNQHEWIGYEDIV